MVTSYISDTLNTKICPLIQGVVEAQLALAPSDAGYCRGGGYGLNANFGWSGSIGGGVRLGSITEPSEKYLFSETMESWGTADSYSLRLVPRGILAGSTTDMGYSNTHFRHNGFANVAWCDGHVSNERPAELGTDIYEIENNIGYLSTSDKPYRLTSGQENAD